MRMAVFEDSRRTALSEFKHKSMAPDCMNTHMAWQACNIYVHTHTLARTSDQFNRRKNSHYSVCRFVVLSLKTQSCAVRNPYCVVPFFFNLTRSSDHRKLDNNT